MTKRIGKESKERKKKMKDETERERIVQLYICEQPYLRGKVEEEGMRSDTDKTENVISFIYHLL